MYVCVFGGYRMATPVDGQTSAGGLLENGVDVGKESVAAADRRADVSCPRLAKEPGLPSLGI